MAFFIYLVLGVKEMAEEKNLDLLSFKQACEYLGFSRTFMYKLCREKKIPHVKLGRRLIFRKSDLFYWLGNQVCEVEA